MEMNAESVLDALNDFERKPSEVPPILEDYLLRVAQNGEIIFPWSKLKPLLKRKLEIVLDEFYETCPVEPTVPVPNFQTFNFDSLKKTILSAVDAFNSAPFTIQRICELVTNPKKHYNRTDKYMRGIEKNVLVVSTIEPRIGIQNDANANVNPIVNGMIGDSPHSDNDCFNGHENNENEAANNLNSSSNHVLLDNFANVFPSAACIPSPSNICINRESDALNRVIENNFLPSSECIETQEVGFDAPESMDSESGVEESKEEQMDTTSESPFEESSSEASNSPSNKFEVQSADAESSDAVETENKKSSLEPEEPQESSEVELQENLENVIETEVTTAESVTQSDIELIVEDLIEESSSSNAESATLDSNESKPDEPEVSDAEDVSVQSDVSASDSVQNEAVPLSSESSPSEVELTTLNSNDNKPVEPEPSCQQDDTVSQSDDSVSNDSSEVSQSEEASNETSEAVPNEEGSAAESAPKVFQSIEERILYMCTEFET